MPVRMQVSESLQQERDKLGRFTKMFDGKAYSILVEEITRAQQEVQMQVPVDTGRLKTGSYITLDPSSGKLRPTIIGSAEAIDPDTGEEYAEIQHETTTFKHPNGGKPFFIRDPFVDMVARIDRRFRSELGYE